MTLVLDGSGYVEVPDSASLKSPTDAITITCWVNLADVTQESHSGWFVKDNGASGSWRARSNAGQIDRHHFGATVDGNFVESGTGGGSVLSRDTWYFYVGRWSSSAGTIRRHYYDTSGVQHDSRSEIQAGDEITYSGDPLLIGAGSPSPILVAGQVAGLFVHNQELSDGQVLDLLDDTIAVITGGEGSPSIAPSAGYWPLDYDARDLSGNGNHGTAEGTADFSEDAPEGDVEIDADVSVTAVISADLDVESPSTGAVREFDGVDDDIHLSMGDLTGMQFGTVALLIKPRVIDATQNLFTHHDASGDDMGGAVYINNSGTLFWWQSGGGAGSGTNLPAAGEWYLAVLRKVTGSAHPRLSVYRYSTDTWAHTQGAVGTAQDDWAAFPAGGTIRFSFDASDFFDGRVAARAAWNNTLPWSADASGDTAIEAAGLHQSIQAWLDAEPDALWAFNQESVNDPVEDLTNGGADQVSISGTTVVPDPDLDFDVEPPSTGAVRELDGVDDDIIMSIGGLESMTHGTVVALIKPLNDGFANFFVTHTSGGSNLIQVLVHENSEDLSWHPGGTFSTTSGGPLGAGWSLVVARKASGSSAPRFSVYNLPAETWAHESIPAKSDTSTPGAGGEVRFSRAGIQFFEGRIAARAAWSNSLPWSADASGDTAIEAAGLESSLQAWLDAEPDALWAFNQASTATPIPDLTGGGANQSSIAGTTVVTDDDPPGFSFDLGEGVAVEIEATATVSADLDVESPPSETTDVAAEVTAEAEIEADYQVDPGLFVVATISADLLVSTPEQADLATGVTAAAAISADFDVTSPPTVLDLSADVVVTATITTTTRVGDLFAIHTGTATGVARRPHPIPRGLAVARIVTGPAIRIKVTGPARRTTIVSGLGRKPTPVPRGAAVRTSVTGPAVSRRVTGPGV